VIEFDRGQGKCSIPAAMTTVDGGSKDWRAPPPDWRSWPSGASKGAHEDPMSCVMGGSRYFGKGVQKGRGNIGGEKSFTGPVRFTAPWSEGVRLNARMAELDGSDIKFRWGAMPMFWAVSIA